MTAVLWLAIGLPALAAVAVRLAPARAGTGAVAGAAAAAVPAWWLVAAAAGGERAVSAVVWLPGAGLEAGLRLDPLSAVMSALVATVGLAVVVHATGYFAGRERASSALAGLLGFLAAMQGLVLAEGFLTLLVFWELVGAASARLIAFERDAAPAAVRAFLTTRAADVGLYLAVLALFAAGGSLAFDAARPEGALGAVVGVGLVVAAVGKSAQAPLQTWLMGAMAGPTPVSALLHSATMVAAGVFLLMRAEPVLAGWPLEVAGWVGAVTAVVAAGIALAQDDLKRVLAASTSSHLGLMVVGVAAGGPVVGLLHLVAHAAAKAGLFLVAGVLQHARGGTGLDRLRGAGRDDRPAFAAFALCAASIAAVPPLAAFWSKEHVAAAAEHASPAWFALVLVAAAGSAAYLLRPALVLWAPAPARPRAGTGRPAMLAAAGALAAASLVLGALGGPLHRLLGGELPSTTLSLALSLVALAGGVAAVLARPRVPAALRRAFAAQLGAEAAQRAVAQRPVLGAAAGAAAADDRLVDPAVHGAGRGVLGLARGAARLDDHVVDRAVGAVGRGGVRAAAASDVVERRGIDAAVRRVAALAVAGGERGRRRQSGHLFHYLRDTVAGIAVLAAVLALTALL